MESFDWVILGAGAAGLSLANELIDRNLSAKILILELSPKTQNDRTWCYWNKADLYPEYVKSQQWESGIIRSEKSQKRIDFGSASYRMIRSKSFYRALLDRISNQENVEIRYEKVLKVKGGSQDAQIITDKGSYLAQWVFNSLITFSPVVSDVRWGLKQHFVGHWIKSKTPIFDPSTFSLMDYRVPQVGGAQFVYVLPMSPYHALIEYTVFSASPWKEESYEAGIARFLQENFGLTDWEVLEKEAGIIPMSSQVFPRISEDRIIHIGTAGGLTKASTGYTFHRIQKDSQALALSLDIYGRPIPELKGVGRFAFYDRLLLWLISNRPKLIPAIMQQLFARNSAKRVFRFLQEETSLWQEILIFCKLPWLPFLTALWYEYFQTQSPQPMGSGALSTHLDLPAS